MYTDDQIIHIPLFLKKSWCDVRKSLIVLRGLQSILTMVLNTRYYSSSIVIHNLVSYQCYLELCIKSSVLLLQLSDSTTPYAPLKLT